jgi:hypothetical protein
VKLIVHAFNKHWNFLLCCCSTWFNLKKCHLKMSIGQWAAHRQFLYEKNPPPPSTG